jgi:hypothetical protein
MKIEKMKIENWNEHAIAMSCIENLMSFGDVFPLTGDEGKELLKLALIVEAFEDKELEFNKL